MDLKYPGIILIRLAWMNSKFFRGGGDVYSHLQKEKEEEKRGLCLRGIKFQKLRFLSQ